MFAYKASPIDIYLPLQLHKYIFCVRILFHTWQYCFDKNKMA